MLRARLIVEPTRAGRPEEFSAVGVLANEGEAPIEVRPALIESPSLALEIVDERGEPVLLPPPPVPGGATDVARLEQGEELSARIPTFLPAWTAPGAYQARLRYRPDGEETVSEWVEFELADS